MKVRAKVISGHDESFDVTEETTVEQFRRLVSERISIVEDKIRLLFQGRFLSDKAKTLAHYGVQDGFVIHVVEQMNATNHGPAHTEEANQLRRRNTGGSYTSRRVLVPPVRSVITFVRGGAVTEPTQLQELVRRAIDQLPIIPEEVRSGLRIDMTATGLTVNMPALNCPHVPSQALERVLSIDRILKYMRFFRASAERENGMCAMVESLLDSTHWPPDDIIKVTRAFLLDMDSFADVNMPTREYESDDPESAEYQARYQSYPQTGEENNMSPYVSRHALACDLAKKHEELHEEYMSFQPHIKRYNCILNSHHVFNIEERDYLLTDPRANILCVYSQHVRKTLHKYSHALHIIAELNVKLEDPLPRRLYPQNRMFQFSSPSQGQIAFEIVDPHNPNRIETARHQTATDMFRCTSNEPSSFDGLISLYPSGFLRPNTIFAPNRGTNSNRTLAGTRRPIIVDGRIEMPPPLPPGYIAPTTTGEPTTGEPAPRRRVYGINNRSGSPRASIRSYQFTNTMFGGSFNPNERSSSARAPEQRTYESSIITPNAPHLTENRRTTVQLPSGFNNPEDIHRAQTRSEQTLLNFFNSLPGAQASDAQSTEGTVGSATGSTTGEGSTSRQPSTGSFRRPYLTAAVLSAYSTRSPSTESTRRRSQTDDYSLNLRMEEILRDYYCNSIRNTTSHANVLCEFFANSIITEREVEPENVYERFYKQIIDAGLTNIARIFGGDVAARCVMQVNTDPATMLPSIISHAIRDFVLPGFLSCPLDNDTTEADSNTSVQQDPTPSTNSPSDGPGTNAYLDNLTRMLEATAPVFGGVEIRIQPNNNSASDDVTVLNTRPTAVRTDAPTAARTDPPTADSPAPPRRVSRTISNVSNNITNIITHNLASTLNDRGSHHNPHDYPATRMAGYTSMRNRALNSENYIDPPPAPIDPFLNCDSMLDLSGADSALTGSMFHQISSSRMFTNTFRESIGGRRRNPPAEPYGVPSLSEIRMALTHNGEIISPNDEKSAILIIQHAIRWILLLMRENDISRVEETAGRTRHIIGIRQLHDEIVSSNSEHQDERNTNRPSLFPQDSLSSLLLSEMPEPEFGRGNDSNDSSSARTSTSSAADTGAHAARSGDRSVHALWAGPLRLDANTPTHPIVIQANSSTPIRPITNMRIPSTFVNISTARAAASQAYSPVTPGTPASRNSTPLRQQNSIRIAVPVLSTGIRNAGTSERSGNLAEQVSRQVGPSVRNNEASVSLLTNSRAGSPSSSTSQERSSNSREAITVRGPEQGTSPRAKKRKTETDTSSASVASRALFSRRIPSHSISPTSWVSIISADVSRQRTMPPRVVTFSRGYLAGGFSARTASSLPRSTSFTGIVDTLTHLSVDGFPESPMAPNLDFLDEPD